MRRVVVRPKLVSKGNARGMLISRRWTASMVSIVCRPVVRRSVLFAVPCWLVPCCPVYSPLTASQQEAAVAVRAAFVAGNSQPARKRRFQCEPVARLERLCQLTLLRVAFPVVDMQRHSIRSHHLVRIAVACSDRLFAQCPPHPLRPQPPLRNQPVSGQPALQRRGRRPIKVPACSAARSRPDAQCSGARS